MSPAKNGWGTDPAERAFYRVFRDFSPLNDLGSGYKTREAAVTGRALKQSAANDERERERQGMKEITRKQFTLGKQRLLGRKAIPMAARAVSFYCSPDAAAMFGTNSKSPTDQSR